LIWRRPEEKEVLEKQTFKEVDILLDICRFNNFKGTFFVLGELAEKYPSLVEKIDRNGHEIASHGYTHQTVYNMKRHEFERELRQSKEILEKITGKPVQGYRAPMWSVSKKILPWYYDALKDAGYKYSSSVFPTDTILYGIKGFPDEIHFPTFDRREASVLEIPAPTMKIWGKKVGFSGGIYLRMFSEELIVEEIGRHNESGKPVFTYIHPREIDINKERLQKLSYLEQYVCYWGVERCREKFNTIIKAYADRWCPLRDIINSSK